MILITDFGITYLKGHSGGPQISPAEYQLTPFVLKEIHKIIADPTEVFL